MLHPELLEILRCPACAKENKGELTYHKESWLICKDCGRKYHVVDDIPVMLIDEGSKWIETAPDQLQIPPVLE